jgi:monofunctional biosynthetic peptidoglycan transglycosylase
MAVTVLLPGPAAEWEVVNDSVMGGVSSAQVSAGQTGALRFAGTVRLDFNGGFSSARRALRLPADAAGLAVRARGDGNRYRLTLFTAAPGGGRQPYLYYAIFTPAGEAAVELRWADFRASLRGRPLPEAPPLTAQEVIGLGLMITKAEHAAGGGAFALELLSVEPLRPESGPGPAKGAATP